MISKRSTTPSNGQPAHILYSQNVKHILRHYRECFLKKQALVLWCRWWWWFWGILNLFHSFIFDSITKYSHFKDVKEQGKEKINPIKFLFPFTPSNTHWASLWLYLKEEKKCICTFLIEDVMVMVERERYRVEKKDGVCVKYEPLSSSFVLFHFWRSQNGETNVHHKHT